MKTSLTDLKKQWQQKPKEELVRELSLLYQKFPQVKDYYQVHQQDAEAVLAKYKGMIEKEFIAEGKRGFPRARFSVARKALNDFKKLSDRPDLLVDLMLTYVASVSHFNSTYAPDVEDFYTRAEDMFEQALELAKRHDIHHAFQERARNIVRRACDGWGHQDSLEGRYADIYDES